MKFTHGIWEDRRDTVLYSATEVVNVSQLAPDRVKVLCATRHVEHRGNTLNRPTITLTLSAAAPGIIACAATHFKGARKTSEPRFELFPDGNQQNDFSRVSNDADGSMSVFSSGNLQAEIDRNPSNFCLNYQSSDGQALARIGYQGVQYIVGPPTQGVPTPLEASTKIADPYYRSGYETHAKPYMSVAFDLQVGELVYGLGERFGPLTKNGQSVELWNEDAGTCTPYTYKNIPFFWTNRGYGIFFDHSDALSLEIQTERLGKVQTSIQGEEIRWFVIHGPTPKEILKRYALLTGHPTLPPSWSFGLYLSTSFITNYSEEIVTKQLDEMARRDIPLSVFHFDCFWMREYTWTSFKFDPVQFPDAGKFLDNLHKRNLKVCVWINPYIAQESEVFDEAMEAGYLIKRVDGTVWQGDNWQAGMAVVDFTNPAAVKWYQGHLKTLLRLGVDTFKTDFGERIPWEGVQFHNGMDPRQGHNYYALLYNLAVFKVIAEERGLNEAAVFARAATAGGQMLPVHWGGDCESTWPGMLQSLRGGLSLGMSGFSFWSHDIAGFIAQGLSNDVPDAHIYKRWVQFGLLSSHSRLHGSHTYRVPWLVDEEAVQVLAKFSRLKNMLMPYIFAQAINCCEEGLPMLRAMAIEFPEDRTCATLDEQYMFGESLLVAPIFNDQGTVEYYLPKGTWTGLLDGKARVGPGWIKETFDNFHLPLLVREGHAILIGTGDRPDYDWPSELTGVAVGKLSADQVIEVPIPSATAVGTVDSTLKVSVSGGQNVGEPRVERGGSGSTAPVIVLGPDSHL
ncbi:Alpha-xylosidase [Fusarium oxysporum f. sp. cubense]|uniref:alpha-D-xyloside xylohydrolase n=1 Tax=Fusarium oxysporum f. sp. cubense TaxID=61366 RepID=A0A559KVI5_FUSOC|nr:Alpha-xylosidase [Fusarium oxysporum f. sp. cubense]